MDDLDRFTCKRALVDARGSLRQTDEAAGRIALASNLNVDRQK
jgi:hypothetical protein